MVKLGIWLLPVLLGLTAGVVINNQADEPQVLGFADTGQVVELNQGQAAKAQCTAGSDRIRTSRRTVSGKEVVTFVCVTPRPPRPTRVLLSTASGVCDCTAQCAAIAAAAVNESPLESLAVGAETSPTPPISPTPTRTPTPSRTPTPTPTLPAGATPYPTYRPSATPVPTLPPTPAIPQPTQVLSGCVQACTAADQCSSGRCRGLVNGFSGPAISQKSVRAAIAADFAWMATDQNIYTAAGAWRIVDAAAGKGTYSIVSRKATTLNVYLYRITAPDPQLDPRTLLLQRSLNIGANQVVGVEVAVPSCGRYAVNFGSPLVVGTKYHVNKASPDYFWGDGDLRFACVGCCQ